MPEYRRFVSYIYEYLRGKKGENCGFVKVELRNGNCRLLLRLQLKKDSGKMAEIYGFVRVSGKILGIRLGSGAIRNRICEAQIQTPASGFGGSGFEMDDIRGIWIKMEQGEDYITLWDDGPLETEQFVTSLPEEEPEEHGGEERESLSGGEELHIQETEPLSGRLMERWENFLLHYPKIEPFPDDEIYSCIQAAPKDLSFLPKEEWQYRNNPFLRQAYANQGHILLGCHREGRFVLGVPGFCMDMQDHHLARMCGFPLFKEAIQPEEVREDQDEGIFGYWYHFLNERCPENF